MNPQKMKIDSQSLNLQDTRTSFRSQSFVVSSEVTSGLKNSTFNADTPMDLQLPEITFVEESDFKKDPNCFVCKIPFGQLKDRQHHCRICSNSCCKQCSYRTINKVRVCDICFLKASSLSFEKKRNKFLKNMKSQSKKIRFIISHGQRKIDQLNKELFKQQEECRIELEQVNQETKQFQAQLTQKAQERQILMENNQQLQLKQKKAEFELEQAQIKAQNTQNFIRGQDTDIYLSEQKLADLQNQIIQLKKQKEDLLNQPIDLPDDQSILQEQQGEAERNTAYNLIDADLIDSMMGLSQDGTLSPKLLNKKQSAKNLETKEVKGCTGCQIY